MADRVTEVADRLYGLPLEDFTRERDAAAKELRREKERDAAAEVGKLPKPSAGAWAVNALAREQPELRDELLAAGEALRDAQEAAIGGGGANALRDATARERAAVDAMLDAARDLRPGGRPLSTAALDRLRQTLHAAAGDDEIRDAIAAGRLVRDAEGGGAWPLAAFAVEDGEEEPKPERRPRARAATAQRGRGARRKEEARRAEDEEEEARRREIEQRLAEARAERRARERELSGAEREAARAADRLERAEAELQEARERADEAREHAEEARAELEAAQAACERARDEAARLEELLD